MRCGEQEENAANKLSGKKHPHIQRIDRKRRTSRDKKGDGNGRGGSISNDVVVDADTV